MRLSTAAVARAWLVAVGLSTQSKQDHDRGVQARGLCPAYGVCHVGGGFSLGHALQDWFVAAFKAQVKRMQFCGMQLTELERGLGADGPAGCVQVDPGKTREPDRQLVQDGLEFGIGAGHDITVGEEHTACIRFHKRFPVDQGKHIVETA